VEKELGLYEQQPTNSEKTVKKSHSYLAIAVIAIALIAYSPVFAQSQKDQENKFGLEIGWKYFNIQHDFSHNTHSGDSFLQKASVPGSAGTTTISGANFLAIGLGYESPLFRSFTFQLGVGGLVGSNRDRKQNANDSRPTANGSFIYSEADYGIYASAALPYHIQAFYIGPEVQLALIKIDSGWDRFGSDESASSSWEAYPSVGGKLGFSIQNFRLEGAAHYGRCFDTGVNLKYMF
jgi:hypothetical protein